MTRADPRDPPASAATGDRTRRRTVGADAGSGPVELVLGVALLILPVCLLVVSVPTWMATQTGARVAAQEAARLVAVRGDGAASRLAAARLVGEVAANRGLKVDDVDLRLVSTADADTIQAAVTVRMPALAIPWLGRWTAIDWTVRHVEPVDPYRSVG